MSQLTRSEIYITQEPATQLNYVFGTQGVEIYIKFYTFGMKCIL